MIMYGPGAGLNIQSKPKTVLIDSSGRNVGHVEDGQP
jgi:hypothetical protein